MELFVDSIDTNCWPVTEHPSKAPRRAEKKDDCRVDLVLRDPAAGSSYYIEYQRIGPAGDRFTEARGKDFRVLQEDWKTPHAEMRQAIYLQSLIRGEDLGVELANVEPLDEFLTDLTTFLPFGTVDQPDAQRFNADLNRRLLREAFQIRAKYPDWWQRITSFLDTLSRDPNLSEQEKGRVQWIRDAERALNHLEKAFPEGEKLPILVKGLQQFILHLFVPTPFGEDLSADKIIQEAAAQHFRSLERGPVSGERPDFYALLRRALEGPLAEIPTLQNKLVLLARQNRLNGQLLQAERECWAYLLSFSNPEEAFKQGLRIKYAKTPAEQEVMALFLRHLTLPSLHLDMERIYDALTEDFRRPELTPALREEKLRFISKVILDQLLSQGKNMEVFKEGRFQETVNFYPRLAISSERRGWAKLIDWTRAQLRQNKVTTVVAPHVLWNKTGFFLADLPALGLGAVGTAVFSKNPPLRSASLLTGGTGIGGALGNLACYLLDWSNRYYQCDILGGILGGTATSLALLALSPGDTPVEPPPPPPPPPRADMKNPTDPFGP